MSIFHSIPELVGLSGRVISTERFCWTYVLENALGDLYVGMSYNPAARLIQHRKGECASSRTGCDSWQRVALYGFATADLAHRFELFLQALPVLALYEYIAQNPVGNAQVLQDASTFVYKHEQSSLPSRHSASTCADGTRVGAAEAFIL